MSTTIADANLLDTLPLALQKDSSMIALAKTISIELKKNLEYMKILGMYYDIDSVPENMLDMMGEDLNIPFYYADMTLAQKREAIRKGFRYHMLEGTTGAVGLALECEYGSGKAIRSDVRGYCHFIVEDVPVSIYDNLDRFIALINEVKRESAILDCATTLLSFDVDVEFTPNYLQDEDGNQLTNEDEEALYV